MTGRILLPCLGCLAASNFFFFLLWLGILINSVQPSGSILPWLPCEPLRSAVQPPLPEQPFVRLSIHSRPVRPPVIGPHTGPPCAGRARPAICTLPLLLQQPLSRASRCHGLVGWLLHHASAGRSHFFQPKIPGTKRFVLHTGQSSRLHHIGPRVTLSLRPPTTPTASTYGIWLLPPIGISALAMLYHPAWLFKAPLVRLFYPYSLRSQL